MSLTTTYANAPAGKKRIEWVDALRGFTMILVVFSHIEIFGYEYTDSTVKSFFCLFHMPLFFFISGFMAYRADEVWTRSHFTSSLLKKFRIQIIPTLFFGLLFAITVFAHRYGHSPIESVSLFLNSPNKLGYWFTLALLAMFIIYYTVSFLLSRCKLATRQLVLAGIALLLYMVTLSGSSTINSFAPAKWFCLFFIMLNFQFFVFGNIFACHRQRIFKFLQRPNVIGAAIFLLFGLYIANIFLKDSALFQLAAVRGASKLIVEAIRYLGIICMVAFFHHNENIFSSATRTGRCLQYIGRRTLDIYLLHYFLIPNLPTLGQFFESVENTVIQTTCSVILTMLIIGFCLLLSNFIRTSSTLAYYLFGAKRESQPRNNQLDK